MVKTLQLFLIDDDEDDRALFAESIKEVDDQIQLTAVGTAMEAMRYLSDESNPPPTHIFLDLRMPGMDGKKCLRMIRAIDRLEDVPVIIYTTTADPKAAEELMEIGATHFTTKPVKPEEVYYILSVIVNEQW